LVGLARATAGSVSRVLDLVLAGVVLALGCLLVVIEAVALRFRSAWLSSTPGATRASRQGEDSERTRRIVYLGTGQIAQVFPRNGVNLFLERECSDFGGYFEQMWNVHFPAGGRGRLDLTPRHHLVDIDFCLPGQRAQRLRLTQMVWREIAFLLWLLPFLT